jgi:hypothetical protein
VKISLTLQRQVWFAIFGVALLLAFGRVATKSGPLAPTQVTMTQVVHRLVASKLFGILPANAPAFIVAQFAGALVALPFSSWCGSWSSWRQAPS